MGRNLKIKEINQMKRQNKNILMKIINYGILSVLATLSGYVAIKEFDENK